MRKSRLISFFIAILLGVVGGLVLGWRYLPAAVNYTNLPDLRQDYKADYVLMVAEIYSTDGNIENATALLKKLDPANPLRAVEQGLLTAQQIGFAKWEISLITDLEAVVRDAISPGDTP